MLHQDEGEFPLKGKVLEHEDSQADGTIQPKTLVMAVPQADSKTASVKAGAQVRHAKHAHAIGRHGIFLTHRADLTEASASINSRRR